MVAAKTAVQTKTAATSQRQGSSNVVPRRDRPAETMMGRRLSSSTRPAQPRNKLDESGGMEFRTLCEFFREDRLLFVCRM